jgi:archaellum component FlaC
MAVTTAQIHAAADAIDREGQRPTLVAVRARLGQGSFTTIAAAMKDWIKQEDEKASPADPIPTEIEEAANRAIAAIWTKAQEVANEALKAKQTAHEAEMKEAKEREADALAELDKVQDSADEAKSNLQTALEKIESLKQELTNATKSMEAANVAANAAQRLAEERLATIQALTNEATKKRAAKAPAQEK